MLNLKKIILATVLAICAIFTLLYLDDLRPSNISENLPFHPEWEIPPLDQHEKDHLNHILSQHFTFLGEGGQSYVFESDDHLYVLKLFKFKRFRPAWIERKRQKLFAAFNGHKLAYDQLREESGLVFIQLNPSPISTMIKVTDRYGFNREVDLKKVSYVVQKKGETLEENFSRLIKEGHPELVLEHINQVLELYKSEYRKGIYDLDHGVMHNIGFVDDKPLHMDVGKLVFDERMKNPEYYQKDLDKVSEKMELWIKAQRNIQDGHDRKDK